MGRRGWLHIEELLCNQERIVGNCGVYEIF